MKTFTDPNDPTASVIHMVSDTGLPNSGATNPQSTERMSVAAC